MINLKKPNSIFSWRILNIKNNILYLEAADNFWLPRENYYYFCKIGNKMYFPKYIENPNTNFFTMYGLIEKGRTILFEIPLKLSLISQIIYFYISYLNIIIEIFPVLGIFSHIPNINHGYYISDFYIIKYFNRRLIVFLNNKTLQIKFENQYGSELQKIQKDYIVKLRKKFINSRNNVKKNKISQIWIINDGQDRAGGNGEYFFRFLKTKKPKNIKPYFAILKNCSDYKRLKRLGGILDLNSQKYKIIFLESKKMFSSVYNYWIYNPFKKDQGYLRDLINFDLIFLQNAIIKDDLSNYINKFNKNFDIIVTSSKKEYKAILNSNYGYNDNNVILTGMPRYDYLQSHQKLVKKEKNILIFPTWRKSIKKPRDIISDENNYSFIFKSTKFFKFYNRLINDKRLLLIMKQNNYTGTLCLHPLFETQWIDFKPNKIFSINKRCDYLDLSLKSCLLITDYSSIFFDFGYIRKPTIYVHFDYDDYRKNQYKEGYFDYNTKGFGRVCKDINCTVNEIIFEIENNCILLKKYFVRIKNFFAFFDENNNERILNKFIINENKTIKDKNILIFFYLAFTIFILFIKLK